MSQNGLIVAGPTDETGGEPRFRLTEEWITAPRRLEGEEALAELAWRFARGRGPVTERDLAWWTGLGLREVRTGLAAAASAGQLSRLDAEGRSYWAEPELLAGPSAPPEDAATLMLPGFDEHLLGYTERDAVLDSQNFERIVPGRNGMFRATVVEQGRVVGVWTRTSRTKSTRIQVEPFPRKRLSLARLRHAAEKWSAFQGVDVEVEIVKA
ncbi:MAG: AlkZ family DNA glycosylase [Actinobacteria bacterium]|nr:AlkZ family DNA glycosylase [Actinomycetota bacterium]